MTKKLARPEKKPGDIWSDARKGAAMAKRLSQASDPKYFSSFMEKVIKDLAGDCWVWTAFRDKKGYGRVRFMGKTCLAHRVSLVIHGMDEVDALHACHKCDNPPCVNPDHLFVGTNADNIKDMVSKGRNAILRGPQKPFSKLTLDDLRDVRARLARGEAQKTIAEIYQIHSSQINRIASGKAYKGVF